ncbi:hypothetical protein [Streptomyces sp. Tu 3180]|uniref:hypothetical protein n=1 Tax=Streptomyces sp. Tu 3180 TaxID=2682611 RepID=UPI001358E4CB|nr:hypothetical protein [Streptomyces sp. Tu 3180]KAF3467934.1 hypothetical protein GL259_28950 [Streptomyces sp. Tu 3180]
MTLGALAVTADPDKRAGAGVPLPHTVAMPFDDLADDDERAVTRLVQAWGDRGRRRAARRRGGGDRAG